MVSLHKSPAHTVKFVIFIIQAYKQNKLKQNLNISQILRTIHNKLYLKKLSTAHYAKNIKLDWMMPGITLMPEKY